jgi:hypothetical protein
MLANILREFTKEVLKISAIVIFQYISAIRSEGPGKRKASNLFLFFFLPEKSRASIFSPLALMDYIFAIHSLFFIGGKMAGRGEWGIFLPN